VDIHFVCSFCLFSVTILQYLISLLRCAQTDRQADRQSMMMMVASREREWEVLRQSSTNHQHRCMSRMNAFLNKLPATLYYRLSFSTVFTCLTAKTSCMIRFVANHDDTHPLYFSLSLSLPIHDDTSGRSRERKQKKINVCIYGMHM